MRSLPRANRALVSYQGAGISIILERGDLLRKRQGPGKRPAICAPPFQVLHMSEFLLTFVASGHLLGGIVALLGVCVVAIPTAMIGAGFMDELRYSAGGEWSDVPG